MNNKERWDRMSIPSAKGPTFKAVADRLLFNRPRYEAVTKALAAKGYTIPWEFIAVTHQREASGNFNTYLGNGQALNKKTTIVPKGRGPFSSWEEGAIDALVNAPPYAAKNKDWSIGGMLNKLEEYNGLGYRNKGVPSPYLWAGTNQYVKGKYVADHKYDPNHVDTQLGCAGLLKFLGYGKPEGGAVIAGSVVAAGVGITAVSYWDHVMDHWLAYGLGTAAVVGFIWLLVYAYNHKDELSV
jgi:lysozyme family protein